MACIKTTNDIVTQPSAPSARQAVSKAAQAPAAPVPYTPPTAPPLRIELSSANQAVTTAHRAVRQATSVEAVRQAVTDAANALYDARHARASGKELRTLTSSYRSLQTQARSKIQSLGQTDEAAANNDGTVFQTRSPRGTARPTTPSTSRGRCVTHTGTWSRVSIRPPSRRPTTLSVMLTEMCTSTVANTMRATNESDSIVSSSSAQKMTRSDNTRRQCAISVEKAAITVGSAN